MLDEAEILVWSKRRVRIMSYTIAGGGSAMLLCILLFAAYRESLLEHAVAIFGPAAEAFTPAIVMILSLLLFLVPSCLADARTVLKKTHCPLCKEDLTSRLSHVLVARTCPICTKRILLGGKTRSTATLQRHQAIQFKVAIGYAFWGMVAFNFIMIIFCAVDQKFLDQNSRNVLVCPLFGAVTSGWAYLRTFHARYALPLLASAILLGLGCLLYSRTLQAIVTSTHYPAER